MTFKIIRNVPPLRNKRAVYDFAEMEVGDAFDAPRDRGVNPANGSDRRQVNIANCARRWAARNNPTAKFSTTLLDANTVRCRRDT